MSDIPRTWVACRLGDVVDYGATRKAEPEEIPADGWILELEDIEKDTSKVLQRMTFAQRQSKSTKNRFSAGDVLYGKLRPYLNKVIRANQDGFCTTEIVPLTPSQWLNGGYLFYWLKHPTFLKYVTSVSHGLNMPRLGTEAGRNAPFVLAPLSKQQRIADKLDAVFTRVDACRERFDSVPAILKRFRQSVLGAATSGKLTKMWREERSLTQDSWILKTGHEVFPYVTSGSRGWATYYSRSGARFLRVGNLNHETIELDLEDVQHVTPPSGAEGERTRIRVGDILISITADVGMIGLVREEIGEAYINQHLCLARQSGEFSGAYLAYFIASPTGGLAQLTKAQRGATKAGLTLEDVRELQFQVPSRAEQDEVVRCIETLFAYADRLELRYSAAHAQVDRLTPSLLAKAFRGDLVPQDPNDEPASGLLERIHLARASVVKTPRTATIRITSEAPKIRIKSEVAMLELANLESNHLAELLHRRGRMAPKELWQASHLRIEDFYEQLRAEELIGLLREVRDADNRYLEAI